MKSRPFLMVIFRSSDEKHPILGIISAPEAFITPHISRIWNQTRPDSRKRQNSTVPLVLHTHSTAFPHFSPHFYHTVRLVLTPGTASLTDTSYSGQLLMCYPCPLSASHGDWFSDLDGTSAALVAVRCLSVWPLGRQYLPDGSRYAVLQIFSDLSSSCPVCHFHLMGLVEFSVESFSLQR